MKYQGKMNNLYMKEEQIRREFVYPMGKLQNSSLKQTGGRAEDNESTHETLFSANKRTTTAASWSKK